MRRPSGLSVGGMMARVIGAAVLALGTASVQAQDRYPSRPIELIVPFAPGGPTDVATRLIAPLLSAQLGGSPVVVVNRAGAGGVVGMDAVARAEPNGYTLAASTNSTLTTAPVAIPNVNYKLSDFAAIGSFATDYSTFTTRPDPRWKTLDDFIAFAKRNPGKLSYGSAGAGTISFFNMEILKVREGLDIVHIPFQGTGPVTTAILGGQIDVAASAMGAMLPHVRSKKLELLATTSPRRIADAPNVPTMVERGIPEATLNTTAQLFAPARTPPEIVARLRTALERVMQDPGMAAAMEKASLTADYENHEQMVRSLEADIRKVQAVAGKMKFN